MPKTATTISEMHLYDMSFTFRDVLSLAPYFHLERESDIGRRSNALECETTPSGVEGTQGRVWRQGIAENELN
jgi:hypothetical protein